MNSTNQLALQPPINYTKNTHTMKSNQFFDGNRFRQLLSREVVLNQRIGLIVLATLFLILFINALTWAYNREGGYHAFGYPFFLVLTGSILSSLAFTEMDQSHSKQFYLLLPASHFEKFLSKWLLLGVGYFAVFTIGYYLMAFVAQFLGKTLFEFDLGTFSLLENENQLFIQLFFALQALFLLGAVYFRKYAVFKTLLSTFLTVICLVATAALLFRIVMFDMFEGLYYFRPAMEINGEMMTVQPSSGFKSFMQQNGESIIRLWGFWIIPAVLLVVGYFKLKEKEL
ncbi:MAG: hypothetical protein AAGJ18_09120 [Bacteroidota bacterium]